MKKKDYATNLNIKNFKNSYYHTINNNKISNLDLLNNYLYNKVDNT